MKTYLNGLCTYLTLTALYTYCNAGLLDILLRRNTTPQQIYNVNNNPSRNPYAQTIQNLAATRDKYNARNKNWGTPSAFHTENKKHANSLINVNDSGNSDSSDDDNRIPRNTINTSPTNIAQNTNEQRVANQVSGFPFINDNSGLNHPLVNQFHGNDAALNPRINNNGNVGNIHKIIHDINKINNIMDQIKQENAKNHGNIDPNIKTNNRNHNFDNPSTGPFTYPMVHVNNGLHGVYTNLHNDNHNNVYHDTSNILSNVQPPRKPETNLNTAVTNAHIIVTPPPGILMTNLPKENVNNKKPSAVSNVSNIGDKYVLKPVTKRKFFSQVRPVVPDYIIPQNKETLYYID
ncbi:putative uncharacterized protein DDB_G0286901 [Pieris rapae]|uniref:putative uncharacterized protein DDB_G0286901 n=1 Tax=Pieris rapae TaxID=64459 RepID=UPI001E280F73|nr:putative uncharacterized protein DDB_G0286901 [Pieris rapae]